MNSENNAHFLGAMVLMLIIGLIIYYVMVFAALDTERIKTKKEFYRFLIPFYGVFAWFNRVYNRLL